jgi:pSer/pThr/pTyr-binding forkhead associated (FHA) protein
VSFETDPQGQFWPLPQGVTLLGRKDAGTGAQVEIDHPTTSSRHAKLYAAARPGRLKLEDLGSTNGTYVNERRLEPGERRTVVHGDSVRFGGYAATIVLF